MNAKSFFRTIQLIIQRAIGIPYTLNSIEGDLYKLKDSNNAIFYYLNNYLLKAEDLPPTSDPELRIMQLCNVQLLRIVDKILSKHNLTYWLDYGTLLGAVRHKGFIPWDDDMDISVPETEYYTILQTLKTELGKFPGFQCSEEDGFPMARIGLGYMHHQTGIWLDIFPANMIPFTDVTSVIINKVKPAVRSYQDYYKKNRKHKTVEQLKAKKNQLLPKADNGENVLYILPPEFGLDRPVYYESKDLYPLCKVEFEGYLFNSPNNYDLILRQNYSGKFMELARGGVLHHGEGRTPLSTWAKASGTDMNKVLNDLKDIFEKI